jgi:hypothetical protein
MLNKFKLLFCVVNSLVSCLGGGLFLQVFIYFILFLFYFDVIFMGFVNSKKIESEEMISEGRKVEGVTVTMSEFPPQL